MSSLDTQPSNQPTLTLHLIVQYLSPYIYEYVPLQWYINKLLAVTR